MQSESQKQFFWGGSVKMDRPTLETLNRHGQIVTIEGAKYALKGDQGKVFLHRVAMV